MKKLRYLLSGLGIASIVLTGLPVLITHAGDECLNPQSPLRGSWSFSQVTEIVPGFSNLPATAVGVIKIDSCGRFQGHAILNIPCPDQNCFGFGPFGVKNSLEVPLEEGQIITHLDGTATSRGTSFGAEFRRTCVVMEKRGDCFQEFRCVSSDPTPPNDSQLSTFKRQSPGACQ